MRKKDFTDEQIKEVIRLYTEDLLGTPSIGKIFGIGKRSINQLLKENGIIIGPSGAKFKGGKTVANKKYREKEGNKEKQQNYMEKYSPKYYKENENKIKEYHKEYRENNIEKENLRHKKYYENNTDKIKEYRENYKIRRNVLHKERIQNDSLYKLKCNTRGLIKQGFKSRKYIKISKTQDILGCSFEEFKTYIETKFEYWMNWDNSGNPKDGIYELNKTWDLDHIIPISLAITEDDVIKLNHYTNFQPLCSYTNRFIKRNTL